MKSMAYDPPDTEMKARETVTHTHREGERERARDIGREDVLRCLLIHHVSCRNSRFTAEVLAERSEVRIVSH